MKERRSTEMADESEQGEVVVLKTWDGTCFEIPVDVMLQYKVTDPAVAEQMQVTGLILDVVPAQEQEVAGYNYGGPTIPWCPPGQHIEIVGMGSFGRGSYRCVPDAPPKSIVGVGTLPKSIKHFY
jgi:hypothetical protein